MRDATRNKDDTTSTSLVPESDQLQHRLAGDGQEISSVTATPSSLWYVAQTHVHAETKATLHLRRQGFDVYLPRYRKQRRHARRSTSWLRRCFPATCLFL